MKLLPLFIFIEAANIAVAQTKLTGSISAGSETFIQQAGEKYGDSGKRAAEFLVTNMPAADRTALGGDFLMQNLSLALAARKTFPWARTVPEDIFLNDVLPYASLDEPRDPWRADLLKLASELVRDCQTATEAAQALNRDLFKKLKVHYHVGRKRTNQSPAESIEQGKATCTGLAIILVDACRAVGVPARIAGVPQWADKNGNHTWVEVWDGGWHFTGADEYDPNGLDHAWFKKDAALTVRSQNPVNQIYATSWRRTGTHFPLAWDATSRAVPAENVSARYAAPTTNAPAARTLYIRLLEKAGGERLAADVELRSAAGDVLARARTRAGTADLNDMPDFKLPADAETVTLRFFHAGALREKVLSPAACTSSQTLDFAWDELTPVKLNSIQAE